ncbi:MAG TPA: peptidylprolyl isomerase [Pyrinomonadaceae bacterium]|jgi:cyclophilin family peptidyl-prolyl cis-trans isomerase/HEAT repeat protein|nr:peptidylprolyl isomerase [Pyrinomonadaceae bacterium]
MPNHNSIVRFTFAWIVVVLLSVTALAQTSVLLRIVKAEDERRWDTDLKKLLTSPNPAIRKRAALAAGRIGNEDSVSALAGLLEDANTDVRAMAAFAIGEVEAASGADALLAVLKKTNQPVIVRARATEALGKIAAALPQEQEARRLELGAAILEALKTETRTSNRRTAILGLTAVLRSRPAHAGPTIAKFLAHADARVRADAGNTLARLRLNDGNDQLRKLLDSDAEPIVRANAARVLGATEDKAAFDSILKHAVEDPDARVRVSAIRSLALLKDARAAATLLKRGEVLTQQQLENRASETNEVLEIATTLGRLLALKDDEPVLMWLGKVDEAVNSKAPEVALAMTRMSPATIIRGVEADAKSLAANRHEEYWREASAIAAALGEIAAVPATVPNKAEMAATAEATLRGMLLFRLSPESKTRDFLAYKSEITASEVLRAFAAFKPKDLADILIKHLADPDVVVRGTAADLLGDLPPSEQITLALAAALPRTEKDPFNDAALSTLDALGKQKSEAANKAILSVLGWRDHLVRRRAVKILKDNGVGDLSIHIGIVQTKNTAADYRRALARIGARKPRAVVTTTKGSFTIELLPEAAPLTVDNFVQLAQRSFFNGIIIHRVVPNFVIQDGDPRGDGNGGPPNHQIRCEINEVPYDRAVVGMALSGKDTGGSQWFVTHSPQPHLDGGYTVFGRVVTGMNVVDSIIRGDVIKSIVIR